MQWIKANERLPELRKSVFAKHGNNYYVINLWVSEYGNKYLNFEGYETRFPEEKFSEIEWLDESVSDGEKDKEIERLKKLARYLYFNDAHEGHQHIDSDRDYSWQQFKEYHKL